MQAVTKIPARGTVLAFDWGEKRVGVAVGELELRTAHPLSVINRVRKGDEIAGVAALVKEWRPVLAVVGVPGTTSDAEHPLSPRCRAFARQIEAHFHIPVHLVDERLSSWAADDLLKQGHAPWQARKARLDPVAAQQILETFFELASPPAGP